jgi:4-hydroxy-tetrahydrodipicolinate synthase
MSIGGEGVVSVVGNIVPRDMIALVTAFRNGDVAEAERWHHKLFPLCRDMLGLATNPTPLKAAMAELGRDTGEMRLPMTPITPEQLDALRQTLATYGLVETAAV